MAPPCNFMNPSLLAAQAIVLFAFFFRSFSGFGGALLSIPLLALFFPLKFIVPVESVLEVALSLLLVPAAIRKVDRANLLRLLAGAVPGSLLGVYFLDTLGGRHLEMILGIVIIGVALSLLRKTPSSAPLSNRWAFPAGIVGGILGGLFGTSGPAYVAYLSSRCLGKEAFRATLIVLFAVEYTWRLGWYLYKRDARLPGAAAGLQSAAGPHCGHRAWTLLTSQNRRGHLSKMGDAVAAGLRHPLPPLKSRLPLPVSPTSESDRFG